MNGVRRIAAGRLLEQQSEEPPRVEPQQEQPDEQEQQQRVPLPPGCGRRRCDGVAYVRARTPKVIRGVQVHFRPQSGQAQLWAGSKMIGRLASQ